MVWSAELKPILIAVANVLELNIPAKAVKSNIVHAIQTEITAGRLTDDDVEAEIEVYNAEKEDKARKLKFEADQQLALEQAKIKAESDSLKIEADHKLALE